MIGEEIEYTKTVERMLTLARVLEYWLLCGAAQDTFVQWLNYEISQARAKVSAYKHNVATTA